MALAQLEPHALDRVQLGAVRRQADQGYIVRDCKGMGCVPSRLVDDHDGVLVGGQRLPEPVQEHLHGDGGHLGQHERKALAGSRLHGGEQVRPRVALVAQAWRALAAGEPAVAHAPFLAEPGFVLEPECQALAGIRGRGPVQRGLQPSFANASRAAGSAFGWDGRAFCRDRPRARTSLLMCPSW